MSQYCSRTPLVESYRHCWRVEACVISRKDVVARHMHGAWRARQAEYLAWIAVFKQTAQDRHVTMTSSQRAFGAFHPFTWPGVTTAAFGRATLAAEQNAKTCNARPRPPNLANQHLKLRSTHTPSRLQEPEVSVCAAPRALKLIDILVRPTTLPKPLKFESPPAARPCENANCEQHQQQ